MGTEKPKGRKKAHFRVADESQAQANHFFPLTVMVLRGLCQGYKPLSHAISRFRLDLLNELYYMHLSGALL